MPSKRGPGQPSPGAVCSRCLEPACRFLIVYLYKRARHVPIHVPAEDVYKREFRLCEQCTEDLREQIPEFLNEFLAQGD